MTLSVKDASGTTQTIKTNDDMAGVAGTPNANVLSVQGASGGTALPVAVGNFPATQAVSGAVTVANLPATQAVSGAVTVSNLPATQAVSVAALPLPAGAATAANQSSLVTTTLGTAARVVLVDPTTGNGSLVQAFHNADNQAVGATSYGLMTGGVDQLINAAGNLDRKRAVSGDAMAVTGLAAEVPMLWNGASYDRATGSAARGMDVALKPSASSLAPSSARIAATASTNATSVKATAGNVYHIVAANMATSARFLKLYNKATAPVVGTDTPLVTLYLPAGGGYSDVFDIPLGFTVGIAYAVTGGVGDGDTTAVAANDVHGVLLYA
jgi:hypothetical protein